MQRRHPRLLSRPRRREFRSQIRRELRGLELWPPLDVQSFCERWGAERGRSVVLCPTTELALTAGFARWLAASDADYIVYQQHTSPPSQRQGILHEVGHIMAGHASDPDLGRGSDEPVVDAEMVAAVVPHLPVELVRLTMSRHAYDDVQEQEAEYIATTILRWSAELEVLPIQSAASTWALDRAVGDARGWL